MNGRGLINTARRERLLKKMGTSYSRIDYQAAPTSWNVSIIKVSGQVRSDAFKNRVRLSLHCNNFDLKTTLYTKVLD